MAGRVNVSADAITIEHATCRDPGVVEYFGELNEAQRVEALCPALALGVAGLRSVSARADVLEVQRGFEKLQHEFDKAFDPHRKTSYLGQLAQTVDAYLGEDGSVSAVVSENGHQVVKQLADLIAQLRDLVVGNIATAAEREKGTAKGGDFESEVEAVLCRTARAYGDTVTNVATEAGEAGRSKKGDFVVTLAQGLRFTVESKNKSTPITLRGTGGILATLEASMLNRQADFGIAVSKSPDALPKEVGSFNEYDTNKVVCAFGDDGALLEVAYRWARAVLLASLEDGAQSEVDVECVRSSLSDARDAVVEIGKVKAKAVAIVKSASDIQNIVEWHVTRAKSALAQAEQALDAGLSGDEAEAS